MTAVQPLASLSDYHPIVQEMVRDAIKKVIPDEPKLNTPKEVVYEFSKGDWTYTVGWCKPKIETMGKKTVYDRETNERVSFEDQKTIYLPMAVLICRHKSGAVSQRRLMEIRGKRTFTDCRTGGLGSGLDTKQIAQTIPGKLTKKDRANLVKWMIYAYDQIPKPQR